MKRNKALTVVSLIAVLAANDALAEEGFYAGFGLGFTAGDSLPIDGAPSSAGSDASFPVLGLTAGYRAERDRMFFGAEVDLDFGLGAELESSGGLKCSDGFAGAPYYCEHQVTVRLRGVVGTALSTNYEGFATLGVGAMRGQGATGPGGTSDTGVSTGITGSLGVQRALNAGTVRVEIIHDNFTNTRKRPAGIFEPTWTATSVKASYIMAF